MKVCTTCFSNIEQPYMCYDETATHSILRLEEDIRGKMLPYQPEEYIIPALIRGDVLKKCGYFASSPHQLTIAAVARSDRYGDIANTECMESDAAVITGFYFTPAACLHFYPELEGKRIEIPRCLTTRARVYRYEAGMHTVSERLWDFAVREYVFIGSEANVKQCLLETERWLLAYVERFNQEFDVVQAFDHFYETPKNKALNKLQLQNNFKREFIWNRGGQGVAIASFNYHGNHFSQLFNFDNQGSIVSGCIGFGLDRWIPLLTGHIEK